MGGHQNSFPGTETPLHQNAPGCDPGFELIRESQNSCGRRSSKSNQTTIRMPLPSTLPLVQWAVSNWIAHAHGSTATKRRMSCRWGKQNLMGFWSKSSFWMLNQECLVPRAGLGPYFLTNWYYLVFLTIWVLWCDSDCDSLCLKCYKFPVPSSCHFTKYSSSLWIEK